LCYSAHRATSFDCSWPNIWENSPLSFLCQLFKRKKKQKRKNGNDKIKLHTLVYITIFSIAYRHNGKEYYNEVGKVDKESGEVVIAILDSVTYLVCTPNRGVLRGAPIMVGKEEVHNVISFEMK
jgi:hypothetical protein